MCVSVREGARERGVDEGGKVGRRVLDRSGLGRTRDRLRPLWVLT